MAHNTDWHIIINLSNSDIQNTNLPKTNPDGPHFVEV